MPFTLPPCCQLCPTSDSLLRCSSCKVVRYCSKHHQVSDWSQHRSACNGIKKSRTLMDREEQKLRDQPDGDVFEPANMFEEYVGHFWGLPHSRPYMRARYALVEAILKVPTYDAVVAALDHVMDCMRLCRSDNMGVRDLVPALLLRLGRDQECYDFVKWWATTAERDHYDWGDMDEPFLDIKNADVLESPQYLCRRFLDLSHAVSITLLKIKLLLAVRAGVEGWEILRSSPTFNQMEDRITRTETGECEKETVEVIKVLRSHVDMLYQAVDQANPHFWGALISPGRHLEARSEYTSNGSKEEMQLSLQRSHDAWKESPGAIEVINAILHKEDY